MSRMRKVVALTLLLPITLVMGSCITYGGRAYPEYPFTTTFYRDGSCNTKVSKGDKEYISYGSYVSTYSMLGNFRDNSILFYCTYDAYSQTASNTTVSMYFEEILDESKNFHKISSSKEDQEFYIFQNNDTQTFELTKYNRARSKQKKVKHPKLKQNYATALYMENANTKIFPFGMRPFGCGTDLYSKNGEITIYSIKESRNTNKYAVISGNLVTGGGRCF